MPAMGSELRRLGTLLRAMIEAPRRWRWRSWLLAVAIVSSVVAAWDAKRAIQPRFEGVDRSGLAESVAQTVSACGGGWILTLAGVAALVVGMGTRRRRIIDAAIVLGAAGVSCWLLVQVTQFVFAESRPLEGGAMHWLARNGHGVSGHASAGALLFGPARVLTDGASRATRAITIVLVVAWALAVGWSRVRLGMHYVWNVELGLAYGWASSAAALTAWRGRH